MGGALIFGVSQKINVFFQNFTKNYSYVHFNAIKF